MYIQPQALIRMVRWGDELKDYEKRRSQKASSIGQKSGFGSAGSRSGGS